MSATVAAKVRLAATVLVTVTILWLLLRRFGGGTAFAAAVRGASPSWVAVALLAACGCVVLGAARWCFVLAAMGYKLPFRRSLEVVLANWPLAMVTPSRVNDLLRPLAVRDLIPVLAGTGSVLAEKAIDLLVLLVFAAAGAAVQGLLTWAVAIGAVAVAELAVIAIVVTHRAWLERIPLLRKRRDAVRELFRSLGALRRAPLRLLPATMASLGMRFLTVAITHALLVSVGARVGLFDTTTLWPAATLVGIVPVTLAGIGTRDAAFIHLLAEHGAHADPAQVLAATVGYSAVAVGFFTVIGLPFMIREALRERRPSHARPQPDAAAPLPYKPDGDGDPFISAP